MSKHKSEEESVQVPVWIITFSDMTTNLLTFFVLLLSMGHVRDDTLFDEGYRLSCYFLQSVKAGFGFRDVKTFEQPAIKYSVDEPEQPQGVTKDAREQRTRRLLDTLRRAMDTRPSQLASEGVDFTVASVRFERDEVALDEADRHWLSQFCADLQQTLDPAQTMLYVVGRTGRETTEAQSWLLAAKRSRAVADFIRQRLSAPAAQTAESTDGNRLPWGVFWWGAGPGADWAGQDQPDPGKSQILIAVLKSEP